MAFDPNRDGNEGGFMAGDMEGGPVAFYQKLDPKGQGVLRSTMRVAYDVVAKGGFIVFVGLSAKGRDSAVVAAEESCQGFLGRWKPGALKNWASFVSHEKDLHRRLAGSPAEFFGPEIKRPKQKERLSEKILGILGSSSERPDLVFAFDFDDDHAAIEEARSLGIPVAAVVNRPEQAADVTYALSDDASHLHHFYAHMIARAAREGITRQVGLLDELAKLPFPKILDLNIHNMLMEDLLVKGTLGPSRFLLAPAASPDPYQALTPVGIEELAADSIPFEDDDGGAFTPSDVLVDMVYRGLVAHAHRLKVAPKNLEGVLRKRARTISGSRILETIAWRARRMIAGVLPNRPLLTDGEFDNDFVMELSEGLPFRRDYPFFPQLKEELTAFLAQGGSIAGSWGHLRLERGAIEFVLAAPNAEPATDWEKPSRIEFN